MTEATGAGFAVAPVRVVLPACILDRSPSLDDGIVASVERTHRFFGCELIQEAGILLRLPQVVMVTAQTMLQRFYYRKSLRLFDAFRVAISCLFLAAKVEERPKRIRDMLTVFYAILRRRKWKSSRLPQVLDTEGALFCQWREWLIMIERQILIDMGFSVYNVTEHPHKYILYYVKIVDGDKELAQRAWGYLNDSLRIDLCVRYPAEVIACAAIFLAARVLQVKLPDNPPWYSLFGVALEPLCEASRAIMELYACKKIDWLDALTDFDPFAEDDDPQATAADQEPNQLKEQALVSGEASQPSIEGFSRELHPLGQPDDATSNQQDGQMTEQPEQKKAEEDHPQRNRSRSASCRKRQEPHSGRRRTPSPDDRRRDIRSYRRHRSRSRSIERRRRRSRSRSRDSRRRR